MTKSIFDSYGQYIIKDENLTTTITEYTDGLRFRYSIEIKGKNNANFFRFMTTYGDKLTDTMIEYMAISYIEAMQS